MLAGVGCSLGVCLALGDEPQPMPSAACRYASDPVAGQLQWCPSMPALLRSFLLPEVLSFQPSPTFASGSPPCADSSRCPVQDISNSPLATRCRAWPPSSAVFPPGFRPWWQAEVTRPTQPRTALVPVAPTGLVLAALAHSAQIRALNESVLHQPVGDYRGRRQVRSPRVCRIAAGRRQRPGGQHAHHRRPEPLDRHALVRLGRHSQAGPFRRPDSKFRSRSATKTATRSTSVPNHQGTARLASRLRSRS